MRIRHYSLCNGSGMHHAAMAMAEAERRLGHDAMVVDIDAPGSPAWDGAPDADVHVIHTHLPDAIATRTTRPHAQVFVAHGTPEHIMENAIQAAETKAYGVSDGWMMLREHLRTADAVVTFWERHAAIYRSMVPRERPIHCVPMGVDLEFWRQGEDLGRFAGEPSVWMSENQHRMKWALDVLTAWPWVTARVPNARLHAHYIPVTHHRFFIDFANSNGAAYKSYLSAAIFPHAQLRNTWKSVDFHLSPVRYGDHNCLSMQAAAAGAKVISYRGNEYADFWITEGDQRRMAEELAAILKGEVTPRSDKTPVPSLEDMGQAMLAVYAMALARATPPGYVPAPHAPLAPPAMPAHVRAHFDRIVKRTRSLPGNNAMIRPPETRKRTRKKRS